MSWLANQAWSFWRILKNLENTCISKAKFSFIKGGKCPQIWFQFFNLKRPQWFTDFDELHCPWTTLNVTWQLWKLFTVKAWPLVFTCSDVEVFGGNDQIGRSCWLWSHADDVWKLLLFLFASFVVVVKRRFTCVAGHLDYRLPLGTCCSEFLHNCLLCGVVSQFLLACFQRCVLDNPLHHIIDAVYPEPLFLVPDICFRVFNYGKV